MAPLGNYPRRRSLNGNPLKKLYEYYYAYFVDASTESRRFNDFLKVTEIIRHGLGIRSQVFQTC